MDISNMHTLSRAAREQMPPDTQFRDVDDAALARHADYLHSLEQPLVQAFYDTLFAYGTTEEVFQDGERPMREKTLADWWHRTVDGPRDDDYFAWMAMVGLVHVIRGVSNPMMIGMANFVSHAVADAVAGALPDEEIKAVQEAYRRLSSTVSAVITYAYDLAIEHALYEVAGMPPALLHRLRDQEVQRALTVARAELGRQRVESQAGAE